MKFQEYVGFISIGYYDSAVQLANNLHSVSWAKLYKCLGSSQSLRDQIVIYPPCMEGRPIGRANVTKMDDRTYYFSIDTFNNHSKLNTIIEILKFYFGGEWKEQIIQNAYVVSI